MPCKMTLDTFKFRDRFVGLDDAKLGSALEAVNAEFTGVYSLWASLPPPEARAKRELCISYLVAWWLADNYPGSAVGVIGTGGMPLRGKKAGPIALFFKENVRQGSGVLDLLTTNYFGEHALQLLQGAPEMYTLFA